MKEKQILKWLAVAGLVLVAFAMAGCPAARSPSATVREFYRALERNDMDALANVATPETVQMMALFGTKIQGMITTEGYTISSLTEQINGDTATVTIIFDNGEEETLDLERIDNRWKVSMSK